MIAYGRGFWAPWWVSFFLSGKGCHTKQAFVQAFLKILQAVREVGSVVDKLCVKNISLKNLTIIGIIEIHQESCDTKITTSRGVKA